MRERTGTTRRLLASVVVVLLAAIGLTAVGISQASASPTSVEGNCLGGGIGGNPLLPVVPQIQDNLNGTVTITWNDQCTNVSYYYIEVSSDNGISWSTLVNPVPNVVSNSPNSQSGSYTTDLLCDGTYLFRIIAVHNVSPHVKTSISSNSAPITLSGYNDCGGGGGQGQCTQLTGALTLGFYSNKNGQTTLTSDDLAFLSSLVLVNYNGTDVNFGSGGALKNFLLNATAKNMSYMISAQLATLELNIRHNPAGWADQTVCEDMQGRTIQEIADDAEAWVVAHHQVLGGDPYRSDGDAVETLLDEINNDLVTVQ